MGQGKSICLWMGGWKASLVGLKLFKSLVHFGDFWCGDLLLRLQCQDLFEAAHFKKVIIQEHGMVRRGY